MRAQVLALIGVFIVLAATLVAGRLGLLDHSDVKIVMYGAATFVFGVAVPSGLKKTDGGDR